MESNLESLKASSVWIDYYYTLMGIFIVLVLFVLYYKKKINPIETLLYSWCLSGFNSSLFGPSISPFTFFTFIFMIEGILIYLKRVSEVKYNFLLIFSPLFFGLLVLLINFNLDIFILSKNDLLLYFRLFYYFLRSHLLYIFLIFLLLSKSYVISVENFFQVLIKICKFSFLIFFCQLLLVFLFADNDIVLELVNIKRRYIITGFADIVRVGAFFPEPKDLAYFLGISFPIFLKKERYIYASLCVLVGLLTLSNSFHSTIFIGMVCFIILKFIEKIRLQLVLSTIIIVLIFKLSEITLEYISDNYLSNEENIAASILFSRTVNRVNDTKFEESNIVLGIPLQRDMELGVFLFFRDNPWLWITGHGIGNNKYIPAKYYWQSTMYEDKINGRPGGGVHMRWLFVISEYGILYFFILFAYLTKIKFDLSKFEKKYFTFLLMSLFFVGNEFIMICLFSIIKRNEEKDIRNNITI